MIDFNEEFVHKCEHLMCHNSVTPNDRYFIPITLREFKKLGNNKQQTQLRCKEHSIGLFKVHI